MVLTKLKTFESIRECFGKRNTCKRKIMFFLNRLYPSPNKWIHVCFSFLDRSIDQTPLGIFRAIFHVRTWND